MEGTQRSTEEDPRFIPIGHWPADEVWVGLVTEGVGYGGNGDGKSGWMGGVLESVQLVSWRREKDFSHVLEKGGGGGGEL